MKSDGSIWFTDPDYGILSDYEGNKAESEIGACHVYRIDGQSGALSLVADDFVKPNGLAFSPDERILYIADTGASHDPVHGARRHMRVLQRLGTHGTQADRRARVRRPAPPACSTASGSMSTGRIWTSAADGVHVYHPDGTLIGKIAIPEVVANVCWGGPRLNRLFICGTSSLYAVMTNTNGAVWPGPR